MNWKFWQKTPAKKNAPQPKKKAGFIKRNVTKLAIATGVIGVVGGGSLYAYQSKTEKTDYYVKIQRTERLTTETCTRQTSVITTDADRKRRPAPPQQQTPGQPPAAQAPDQAPVAPQPNVLSNECERSVTYLIHTDKGVFVNESNALSKKFNSDVEDIQRRLESGTGKYFSIKSHGNVSKNGLSRNILKADEYYSSYSGGDSYDY